jgi:hypothetical protein
MRYLGMIFAAALVLPSVSQPAQVSNDMTCAEAVEHDERNRQIMTIANGQELPIDQGTPIRQADMLNCDGGSSRFETMVETKDKPQCVIAAYCE